MNTGAGLGYLIGGGMQSEFGYAGKSDVMSCVMICYLVTHLIFMKRVLDQ